MPVFGRTFLGAVSTNNPNTRIMCGTLSGLRVNMSIVSRAPHRYANTTSSTPTPSIFLCEESWSVCFSKVPMMLPSSHMLGNSSSTWAASHRWSGARTHTPKRKIPVFSKPAMTRLVSLMMLSLSPWWCSCGSLTVFSVPHVRGLSSEVKPI